MKAAYALVLIAVAAVSLAGRPAEPSVPARPEFCAALKRVIAASTEAKPFGTLRTSPASGANGTELVLRDFQYCAITGGLRPNQERTAFRCGRNLTPPELTAESLVSETARCLGAEPATDTSFELDTVAIHIEERCTDACHVGRSLSIAVEAKRP